MVDVLLKSFYISGLQLAIVNKILISGPISAEFFKKKFKKAFHFTTVPGFAFLFSVITLSLLGIAF